MNTKIQFFNTFASLTQSLLTWVWKNPQMLVYGWAGVWVAVLGVVMHFSGVVNAMLLGTSGMLNVMNPVGMAVPLLGTFIMFAQSIVPMIWKVLEDAAYRIFRKVMDGIQKAISKVQELVAKIAKQIKKLMETIQKFFGQVGDKAKDAAAKVTKGVKKATNNVKDAFKKMLKAEFQEVLAAQDELLETLAEMDTVAPESAHHTDAIRQTSLYMVSETLAVAHDPPEDDRLLGSAAEDLLGLEDIMMGHLGALAQDATAVMAG